jgi:hypothetical protein
MPQSRQGHNKPLSAIAYAAVPQISALRQALDSKNTLGVCDYR